MRYIVEKDIYEWVVWDTNTTGRAVTDNCTEAEAKVIAWSLNSIAMGRRLESFEGDEGGDIYDGPTILDA